MNKTLKLKLDTCTIEKINNLAKSKYVTSGEIIRKALVLYMISCEEDKKGRSIVFTNKDKIKKEDKDTAIVEYL